MSEEIQELARQLLSVCQTLDQLASPACTERVGEHTRAEIHSHDPRREVSRIARQPSVVETGVGRGLHRHHAAQV